MSQTLAVQPPVIPTAVKAVGAVETMQVADSGQSFSDTLAGQLADGEPMPGFTGVEAAVGTKLLPTPTAEPVAAPGNILPASLPPEVVAAVVLPPDSVVTESSALPLDIVVPDGESPPAVSELSIPSVLTPPPVLPARDGHSLSASAVASNAIVAGAVPALSSSGLNQEGVSPENPGSRDLPMPLLKVVSTEQASGPLSAAFSLTASAPPVSAPGTPPAPVVHATVSVPLGQASWGQAFSNQVVWAVQQNISSAQLHLSPPDLGPLSVRISLEQDQASINFSSAHALVRDAIEAALPRLRDMLGTQGIALADANVTSEGHTPQGRPDGSGSTRPSSVNPTADVDDAVAVAAGARPVAHRLLDLYV